MVTGIFPLAVTDHSVLITIDLRHGMVHDAPEKVSLGCHGPFRDRLDLISTYTLYSLIFPPMRYALCAMRFSYFTKTIFFVQVNVPVFKL